MLEKYTTNKKRSPLKNNPLRHPGQSLDEKIYDIFYDKILVPIVIIFLFFFITMNDWMREYYNTSPHPLFWTFVTVIIVVYFTFKIRKNWQYIKNLQLGRDGERIVGQALEELREKGYKVFHDIKDKGSNGKDFNIDHILIGPGGVFTVETKTISKSTKGNQVITYDGVNLKIDGSTPDRDPIKQAKSQKYWLENFINEHVKTKIEVRPVVLFPGWYIDQNFVNSEVWVLNHKAFPSFLEKLEVTLNPEQINLIASHIEIYNRNS